MDERKPTRPGPTEKNPHYIQAVSPPSDERPRVLKHNDTFAVFDRQGDIEPGGLGEEGLYHDGTRFLSCLVLGLGATRPMVLSSHVRADNGLLAVDLTNPDFVALATAFGIRADAVDGLGEHFGVALKGHMALKEPTMLVARAALGPPPNVSPRWYRR